LIARFEERKEGRGTGKPERGLLLVDGKKPLKKMEQNSCRPKTGFSHGGKRKLNRQKWVKGGTSLGRRKNLGVKLINKKISPFLGR